MFGDAAAFGTRAVVARIFARFGITTEVGMALGTKPVERSTHIHFLLRRHVEERQINRGATCVTTLLHDVFLFEEHALVQIRIEVRLHQRVSNVFCPANKVVDSLLRTIGIVYL